MKLNRANLANATESSVTPSAERIVHIGLGAFHRAHQAWYTDSVDSNGEWGIVAFTGRSPQAADELAAQDGLFTLVTRSEAGDEFSVVKSISRAVDINDANEFVSAIANPNVVIVTLTITEAGYGMDANGHIDTSNPPRLLHRLAVALETRRREHGKGIAVVSCDNIPNNGGLLQTAMTDLFGLFSSDAMRWLEDKVSFVSTSVDRITPRTTASDIETVASETGWNDVSPVVTEPFTDWVLEGEFPEGRPDWHLAGAKFVDELEPFENRKLWLLNGAHSLLAYLGQLRGHSTVAQAIADAECLDAVEGFWAEAERGLTAPGLELPRYKAALLERFSNSRIEHQLAQIANDGSTKLRVRIAPTALRELADGNSADGCARVFQAWAAFLLSGTKFNDSRAVEIREAIRSAKGDHAEATRNLIALVSEELAASDQFMGQVLELATI